MDHRYVNSSAFRGNKPSFPSATGRSTLRVVPSLQMEHLMEHDTEATNLVTPLSIRYALLLQSLAPNSVVLF